MNFTERDLDLLETLTRRIRLATVLQVVALWWPNIRVHSTARSRLKELAAAGWLELHRINARLSPTADAPLIDWRPGDNAPDALQVAARIRERLSAAAEPIEVCVASAAAANLFGSSARRLPGRERRDHDLRLATAYIHFRKSQLKLTGIWVGEHARQPAAFRTPHADAVLSDSQGHVMRVIESAGAWNIHQIEAFHENCAASNLPYEMW